MKTITGLSNNLQTNIDQFTMVFKSEDSTNWKEKCLTFRDDILQTFFNNFEYFEYGDLSSYSNVITIKVYSHDVKIGFNDDWSNNGICIYFTSQGSKLLEQELNIRPYTLFQELYKIGLKHNLEGHYSRCDIAVDFINQDIIVNDLFRKIARHTITVVDYRNRRNNSKFENHGNNGIDNTVYIGSSGKPRLRIYNKKKQQQDLKGPYLSLANSVNTWVRFEYEVRLHYGKVLSKKMLDIRDDIQYNSLLLQTMTDRYRFVQNGKYLPYTRMMLNGIESSTPVIFAPKTRLHTDLDKRKDWVRSNTTGFTNVLKDVNRVEGTKEVANVLKELLMISGIEGIDITIK